MHKSGAEGRNLTYRYADDPKIDQLPGFRNLVAERIFNFGKGQKGSEVRNAQYILYGPRSSGKTFFFQTLMSDLKREDMEAFFAM